MFSHAEGKVIFYYIIATVFLAPQIGGAGFRSTPSLKSAAVLARPLPVPVIKRVTEPARRQNASKCHQQGNEKRCPQDHSQIAIGIELPTRSFQNPSNRREFDCGCLVKASLPGSVSRKRGTLWLIGDPPASLCPRSGSMPMRCSLFFSWSTMVPVINTTWPLAFFEGKRTRSTGLRVACLPLALLRIHDRARSTPLVFAGLVARRVEVRPAFADKLRVAAASQLGRLPAQWRVTRASRSLSAFSHLLVQRATASGDIPRGSL